MSRGGGEEVKSGIEGRGRAAHDEQLFGHRKMEGGREGGSEALRDEQRGRGRDGRRGGGVMDREGGGDGDREGGK